MRRSFLNSFCSRLWCASTLAIVFVVISSGQNTNTAIPGNTAPVSNTNTSAADQPGMPEESEKVRTLELAPGQTAEYAIESEEKHLYPFELPAGAFFQVRVGQRGADLLLRLLDSGGEELARMDSPNGTTGFETLSFVASQAGRFTLEISVYQGGEEAVSGYSIQRAPARQPTEKDKKRILIERIFTEGMDASYNGEYNIAVIKLEEAVRGWHSLNDGYQAQLTNQRLRETRAEVKNREELERIGTDIAEAKSLLKSGRASERAVANRKLQQALQQSRKLNYREGVTDVLFLLAEPVELKEPRIERPQEVDKAHLYKINLKRGTLLRATLETKEPGSSRIVLMNTANDVVTEEYQSDHNLKALYFMPEADGQYLLGVISYAGSEGNYVVRTDAPFKDDSERQEAAGSLAQKGRESYEEEKYDVALLYHQQALKLYRESPESLFLGLTLGWIGHEHKALGEFQKAIDFYHESMAVYQRLDEKSYAGNSLNFIGDVYKEMNQAVLAVEFYAQALGVMREAKDSTNEAATLRRLGNVYSQLGHHQYALDRYKLALEISRRDGSDGQDDQAHALGGIANAYTQLGRLEEAIRTSEEELKIVEDTPRAAAVAISRIALAYFYLGQYDRSIEHNEKALAIFREIKDAGEESTILHNIGNVYTSIGSHNRAVDFLTRSIELQRPLKHRRGRLAQALAVLASVYRNMKMFDKAEALLEESLPILREFQDGRFISSALNGLARIARARKQFDRAMQLHLESLSLARSLKLRRLESGALAGLGAIYTEQNRFAEAASSFEQSLAIDRETKSRDGEANTLTALMKLWKKRSSPDLAIFYGKQSVNLLQAIRRDIGSFDREVQVDFIKDNETTYRQLAEILIGKGRLGEAEQVANLLKQEEYFDYIRRDPDDPVAGNKDTDYTAIEEKARLDYLKKAGKVTEIGRRVEELNLKRPRTAQEEHELVLLQRDLEAASKDFQEFLKSLVDQFPNTRAGGEQALRVEDSEAFMNTLGELGTLSGQPGRVAAIYTIVGEKQVSLMVVTSQDRVAETIEISEEKLNALVGRFRSALQDRNIDPRPAGAELYKLIFAPIEKHILPLAHESKDSRREEVITLMWSLDGTLRYVPIAALYDESRKKYLAERFRNTVFTFKSKDKLKDSPSQRWSALGLGVTERRTEAGKNFDPLPNVNEELAIIADETQPDPSKPLDGRVLKDKDFKYDAMYSELNRRRPVVHIASHFDFAPSNDDESFLLLGVGKLTVTQMKQLGQVFSGVQLLALSACNTAMGGKDATGKEVDGFGTFAQDKGAQSVIATLWSVADDSTSELMQKFYAMRASNPTVAKAEALRQAQLAVMYGRYKADEAMANRAEVFTIEKATGKPFRRDPNAPFAHPYFWAPFILIGNWR